MTPYWTSHDGRHRLYHGDCLAVLPTLPAGSVDAVVTDPPYGIGRFRRGFGTTRFRGHGCETKGIEWDIAPDGAWVAKLLEVAPLSIVWGMNNLAMPCTEHFLVWDKEQTVDNFASAEIAWCSHSIPTKVFRYSIHQHNHDKHGGHPTEKPVALMQWCLGFLPPACTVLDPFAGSGTTGVACIRTGRRFIGVELDERYCAIAVRRMEAELAQPMLLPPDAPPTEPQPTLSLEDAQ